MRALVLTLSMCLLWVPTLARAHGVWAHIHVTGWAIENLPPGELRDFFESDPDVFNAAIFGAAFTDSGYAPLPGDPNRPAARAYGEHTHWEPFVQDFVTWILENDPPPWTSKESRMRVAFLMGCASHGLQDEVFDSLFLYQVAEHDSGSQDNADPASDGFLAVDGHIRFLPVPWIPTETLVELYSDLDEDVTPEVMQSAVDLMFNAYVNDTLGMAVVEGNGVTYEPELPWTKAHYLDTNIPGSLRAEIIPTGRYIEAIWDRLHGTLDPSEVVTFAFPDAPRRLLSGDPDSPDSWVTFIYAMGVADASVSARVTHDEDDALVPHEIDGTRWGHSMPRLHRVKPLEALAPGAYFTVELQPGIELIDGRTTSEPIAHSIQVDCVTADDDACPPIDPVEPSIDGWTDVRVPDDDLGRPAEDVAVGEPDVSGADDAVTVAEPDDGEDLGGALDASASTAPPADDGGCQAGRSPLGGNGGWWLVFLASFAALTSPGRSRQPR